MATDKGPASSADQTTDMLTNQPAAPSNGKPTEKTTAPSAADVSFSDKKRLRIIIAAVVFIIAGSLLALAVFRITSGGFGFIQGFDHFQHKTAQISQNGVLLYEIDLDEVREEYTFQVETSDGHYNRITVRPGEIGVSEADCPDLCCYHMGYISTPAFPVVCLPHGLVIRILLH